MYCEMSYYKKMLKNPILMENPNYILREIRGINVSYSDLSRLNQLAGIMRLIINAKGLNLDKIYNKFMLEATKAGWSRNIIGYQIYQVMSGDSYYKL